MQFTPLAISTMTCTCRLLLPAPQGAGAAALDRAAALATLADAGGPGVVSVRGPGGAARGAPFPPRKARAFGVQVTLAVRVRAQQRAVHAKLFGTGMLQMAGALTEAAAAEAAHAVAAAFSAAGAPLELRTCMVNSSLRASARLALPRCAALLHAAGLAAAYDPCAYAAVKVSVFLGEHGGGTDGVCRCSVSCLAKRPRDRRCRMVTASVFHSGAIGVSGGTCARHVHTAAALVCGVLAASADARQPDDRAMLERLRAYRAAA